MPRFPETTSSIAEIGQSHFSTLSQKLEEANTETYPLHFGDTWLEPPAGCRMEDLKTAENPWVYRYGDAAGLPALLHNLAERDRVRSGLATRPDNLALTAGATGGLSAITRLTTTIGDEVLLVAPYWPLINGVVHLSGARPVDVPFWDRVDSAESAVAALREKSSARTAAIYINSPNNPTGRVIPRPWLEAIVEWASRKDLWVVSDEVYEDYVYEGRHTYCRNLAPERCFATYSFSKTFAMGGNRCGFVVGPAEHIGQLRKIVVHSYYSTSQVSQLAALKALEGPGPGWCQDARDQYWKIGLATARRLRIPPPEAGNFLFLDLAPHLDERGLLGFLEDCVERGLLLAPGPSFGPYPTHARICFTAAPPDIVRRGIEVLADLLKVSDVTTV